MKGRLVLSALAAVVLVACDKPKSASVFLLFKDNRFALAIESGRRVEVYPLPEEAVVVVDGKGRLLDGSGNVMIRPLCPCTLEKCMPYCRPFLGVQGFDLPVHDPKPPGGEPVPATP